MNKIIKHQQEVLKALSGKIDDFYLAGGTALSLFYFQHRLSVDLDFFTQDFAHKRIEEVVEGLKGAINERMDRVGQSFDKKLARLIIYNIYFTKTDILKIDFVEDTVRLLKKTKLVDGVRVLSLEDIYLRKLYAMAGMIRMLDISGRDKFAGGRADAKDFYDVYFLSHTFMPLSRFVIKYCDKTMMEAIINWFRTYDRMAMMDGVLTLDTNKAVDCKAMERHFKKETGRILDYELGGL